MATMLRPQPKNNGIQIPKKVAARLEGRGTVLREFINNEFSFQYFIILRYSVYYVQILNSKRF